MHFSNTELLKGIYLILLGIRHAFNFVLQYFPQWLENVVAIPWSSFLSVNFILMAPSDNVFVNKSSSGIQGSPMSRRKW